MKYQLIEQYFETELFQSTLQEYFDTVLQGMIKYNPILQAKGKFQIKDRLIRDYYDMPYHIHILNGLIPVLYVYEKYLQKNSWIDSPESEIYLKLFILGFTFHDVNKVFSSEEKDGEISIEKAILKLDELKNDWCVLDFFKDFDLHKNAISYLSLSTENRTAVLAEDFKLSVENWKHITEVQAELCHLADGLASIQNEHLESIESLYKSIRRTLSKISELTDLTISYVKVRQNPYTLLSQSLLQTARRVLYKFEKKILYTTREGFIYWGDNINSDEYNKIKMAFTEGSKDDIDVIGLTKIDYQKCKFGFIGTIRLSEKVLEDIIEIKKNDFLKLAPNASDRFFDYQSFIDFTNKLIEHYSFPIECENRNSKITLRYNCQDEEDEIFLKIYNLHKIKWLNAKSSKKWEEDFNQWKKNEEKLLNEIQLEVNERRIKIESVKELVDFLSLQAKSPNSLLKTYLNFIKTQAIINELDEDITEYIKDEINDIINTLDVKKEEEHFVTDTFLEKYFEPKGYFNIDFLQSYNPEVPEKAEMCAFTGGKATKEYKEQVAFAMRARGFSNRTVTSLNTTTSHISDLFTEENKLRISTFKEVQGNLIGYYDFFEFNLPISKEIIKASLKAKNIQDVKDNTLEFEKNVQFNYDLGFEITRIKESKRVSFNEALFWFIRDHIKLLKEFGIRSFIANVGSGYESHKEAFYFKGAPQILKRLGWDRVRLNEVDEILEEISLIYSFGKKRINNTMLSVGKGRIKYFTLLYLMQESDKQKNQDSLIKFYSNYKYKFPEMTITEQLVEKALKIDLGYNSSAEETWLMRTGLEFLRKYHKRGEKKEDIIQKMAGEIFRKKRQDNPNMESIEDFCIAIYDLLFLQDWNGQIPSINQEKDWIYQFAFLFRKSSLEELRRRKAIFLNRQLQEKQMPITKESIEQLLDKKTKKYAEQYLEIIQNL